MSCFICRGGLLPVGRKVVAAWVSPCRPSPQRCKLKANVSWRSRPRLGCTAHSLMLQATTNTTCIEVSATGLACHCLCAMVVAETSMPVASSLQLRHECCVKWGSDTPLRERRTRQERRAPCRCLAPWRRQHGQHGLSAVLRGAAAWCRLLSASHGTKGRAQEKPKTETHTFPAFSERQAVRSVMCGVYEY